MVDAVPCVCCFLFVSSLVQAKLEALQKDAPAWLISPSRISPSRISLDQGAGGRLVLLGSGAYGECAVGLKYLNTIYGRGCLGEGLRACMLDWLTVVQRRLE